MKTLSIDDLTPTIIVEQLDHYIVGQKQAKKAVAVALRNRWRRQQVDDDLRDEITPKNIIMIGPTGVGKTEIARRLAKLVAAPFLKIEASKFTEVGYVGRDVESMIRDLTELAIKLVRDEETVLVQEKAKEAAEERLLDLLLPENPTHRFSDRQGEEAEEPQSSNTREKLRQLLHKGKLDDRNVEIEITEDKNPFVQIFGGSGMEEIGTSGLRDMLGNMSKQTSKRTLKVSEAIDVIRKQEAERLVDQDYVTREAIARVENSGIIFLDEIDKISGNVAGGSRQGPDVSREGVQRDLLPIIEGATVTTKHGLVKTDHILFIAAGAFHVAKPSDLIPELQGRFPIRVELESLSCDDFVRILTEPQNAITKQYTALLATDDVDISFDVEAIHEIAKLAGIVNERTNNIGARRLHTIVEKLLDELLFSAPMGQQSVKITVQYVQDQLADLIEDEELTKYIL